MSADELQNFLGSLSAAGTAGNVAAGFQHNFGQAQPSGTQMTMRPLLAQQQQQQQPDFRRQSSEFAAHPSSVMMDGSMLDAFTQQQQQQQQQQQSQMQGGAGASGGSAFMSGAQPFFALNAGGQGGPDGSFQQPGASVNPGRPPFAHRRSQSGSNLPTMARASTGLSAFDAGGHLDSAMAFSTALSQAGILNSTSAPDGFSGMASMTGGNALSQHVYAQLMQQQQQHQQQQQQQQAGTGFPHQGNHMQQQHQPQQQQQQQHQMPHHLHQRSMTFNGTLPAGSGPAGDMAMMLHANNDAQQAGGSGIMGMNVIQMPTGMGGVGGMSGLGGMQDLVGGSAGMPPSFGRAMTTLAQGHGGFGAGPSTSSAMEAPRPPQHQSNGTGSDNQQQSNQGNTSSPPRSQQPRPGMGATPGRGNKNPSRRRSRGASGSFDDPHGADPSSPSGSNQQQQQQQQQLYHHHSTGPSSSTSNAGLNRIKSGSSMREAAVAAAAADGGVGSGAARSIPGISGASGPAGAGLGGGSSSYAYNPYRGSDDAGLGGADSGSGSANAGGTSSAAAGGGGAAGAGGPGSAAASAAGGAGASSAILPVSASATAAAAGAIVSDFTKRKGWSTRIVEELLDFVHVLDFGGRILFASPSVVSITGWKPEELVGKEIVEFIHPNDRIAFVREFSKLVEAFVESQQQQDSQQRQQHQAEANAQAQGNEPTKLSAVSMLLERSKGKIRNKGKGKAPDSATESSITNGGLSESSAGLSASTKATTVSAQSGASAAHSAPAPAPRPRQNQQSQQPDMLFYYRFAKKPIHRRADLLRTKSLSRLTFAEALATGSLKMGTSTPGPSSALMRPGIGGRQPSTAAALSRSASRFGGSDVGSGFGEDGSGVDSVGMSFDGYDSLSMGIGGGGGMGMGMGRVISNMGALSTPGGLKHMTPGSGSSRPAGAGANGGNGSDDEMSGAPHDPYVDREWVVFEVAGHVYVPPPEAFSPNAAAELGLDGSGDAGGAEGPIGAGRNSADMAERRKSGEASRRDLADDIGLASTLRTDWPPEAADNVRCVFCSCRVYPSKNVSMFDSFLELKVENERLRVLLGEVEAAGAARGYGPGPDGEWRDEEGNIVNGAHQPGHLDSNDLGLEAPFVGDILASLDDDVFDDPSGSGVGVGGGVGGVGRPHRPRLTSTMLSRGPSVLGMGGSGIGSPTSPAGPLGSAAIMDDEDEMGGGNNANSGMDVSQDDIKRKTKKMRTEEGDHVCTDCGRVDSPEWRKGPLGPKTLCNACGLRWAKKIKRKGGDPNATASAMAQATANAGRLVPTSPTFSNMPNT
ncbi:white collar 2 type of transcription factor [Tilletia horrida]|nr:white collar 2 type of transcription factor [Tilletia horrida]